MTKEPRPIFILDSTIRLINEAAGSDQIIPASESLPVVAWTDICHGQKGKNFLFIDYAPWRDTSRWTGVEAKRPYIVYDKHWNKLGCSSKLSGAIKIARREA